MSQLLLLFAKVLNRIFMFSFQKKKYYKAWSYFYRMSLAGMGRIQGNSIQENGEKDVLRSVFSANPDQVVIVDIGANKGQYAEAVLTVAGKHKLELHMFEPSSANTKILNEKFSSLVNENLKININQLAVSDKIETTYLYSDRQGSDIASLYDLKIPIRPFDDSQKELVKVVSFDEYATNMGIEHVDLLKIDVEGSEYKVLCGAMKFIESNRISQIQFEFGAGNITARVFFHDFWTLLADRYDFYQILSGGLIPIVKYSNQWEIFRTANFLLKLKNR